MTDREEGLARLWIVARRRRTAFLVTVLLVGAAGATVVARTPRLHRARAVVRLDDPRPAREYVHPTVAEPPGERLASRRLGLLARPVVAEAAARAGLLAPSRPPHAGPPAQGDPEAHAAGVLGALADRLDARQEGEDTFVVTFEDSDPGRARVFITALTEAYRDRAAAEIVARSRATADFFGQEVEALRPRVADAAAQVERFRLDHDGALPEQLEGNLRLLDEATAELHSLQVSLDAAAERRRAILAEARSVLRAQEEEVVRTLSAARARYTPGAPEVVHLERELARVRAERVAEEQILERRARRSPELRAADRAIGLTTARIETLRARARDLRDRVARAARVGEELARLSLDHEVLRERLRLLVAKHLEAAMAAGLEEGVASLARVTIVEPAWVTAEPVGPSLPLRAAVAAAVALAAGLGIAFAIDRVDPRVRDVDDLRRLAGGVPLLGTVPAGEPRRARGRTS